MSYKVIALLLSLGAMPIITSCNNKVESQEVIHKQDSIGNPFLDLEFNREYFIEALIYFDVDYPKDVIAQAIVETGWFKSRLFKNNNNLFGLYDSRSKRYFKYSHWSESILAYKKYFQDKYKAKNAYYNPQKHKDYIDFLQSIGYAEAKDYRIKVNKMKKSLEEIGYFNYSFIKDKTGSK